MSVAKPWMLASPAPSMSHSSGGFPGSAFSSTIGSADAVFENRTMPASAMRDARISRLDAVLRIAPPTYSQRTLELLTVHWSALSTKHRDPIRMLRVPAPAVNAGRLSDLDLITYLTVTR